MKPSPSALIDPVSRCLRSGDRTALGISRKLTEDGLEHHVSSIYSALRSMTRSGIVVKSNDRPAVFHRTEAHALDGGGE